MTKRSVIFLSLQKMMTSKNSFFKNTSALTKQLISIKKMAKVQLWLFSLFLFCHEVTKNQLKLILSILSA
ncbi:MAG: hypothetical protein A3F67_00815 [Verrucomicrobia bacterium RIFCSPHIGHO2_12_FULL_41_10]|nr:MAG: hypothetical protein A3F67_00815 [Verrucomicrobia bacterium RIFCSPHIGHO2_12_FULL_41_10]